MSKLSARNAAKLTALLESGDTVAALALLNAPAKAKSPKKSKMPEGIPEPRGFEILTVGNPKTVRGQALGYLTFILHFAPARLSGFEVCAGATDGCRTACLNTSGQGGIIRGGIATYAGLLDGSQVSPIQNARIRRTRLYFENRAGFYAVLCRDIERAISWCQQYGFIPVFRLNGTSDIRFEKDRFCDGKSVFDRYPLIQFYDYTKLTNRRGLPANYRLTFSRAESNDKQAFIALRTGLNVAVVFRDKETLSRVMASGWTLGGCNFPVIDGTETDLRFLDPRGVIVGLVAKGRNGLRDKSGFVVDVAA